MTDRYMKVIFTIVTLCLIGLTVKDAPLEPVVSAQFQGWEHATGCQDFSDAPTLAEMGVDKKTSSLSIKSSVVAAGSEPS